MTPVTLVRDRMLYTLYEWNQLALAPVAAAARTHAALLRSPLNPASHTELSRVLAAAEDVFDSVARRYRKPTWELPSTRIGGVEVPVTVQTVWSSPWASLLHFSRDKSALGAEGGGRTDPPVLIVAPLSGHHATLLRGTVETFLPDHEVYVTDWVDVRRVPLLVGRFDLHDFIDHVRTMIGQIGQGVNVVGVCQPGPGVLAAVALMEAEDDPCLPATMTFMGSPIDARRSPTIPNKLAEEKPFEWFEKQMIHTVPGFYPGAFRRVYPGWVQLASFMGMNLGRHLDAHREYFNNLVRGDGETAQKHRDFYEEYLSVMDLTEEFYLQTIRDVFKEYKIARGVFDHRGQRVRADLVKRVALMTVEGEKDDISGVGQTQAAHDICSAIPASMRFDYVQPGVGHYGVFNGKRFATEIYPRVREFIRTIRSQHRPHLRVVDAA